MKKEYNIINHLGIICQEKSKGMLSQNKALNLIDACFAQSALNDKDHIWLACQQNKLPSQILIRWYQLTRQADNPRTLNTTSLPNSKQTKLNDSEVLILMQKRLIPPILLSPVVKNTKDSLATLRPKLHESLQTILNALVWGKSVNWQTLNEKLKTMFEPYCNKDFEESTIKQWSQLNRR